MYRLLFISLLAASCNASPSFDKADISFYENELENYNSDSLLIDVQTKIYDTFVLCLMSKDDEKLKQLSQDLETLYASKNRNLIRYWNSYLKFYHSIYLLRMEEKDLAEKELNQGIEWLNEMKKKNSEDHALLAKLLGFSIPFNKKKTIWLSMKMKKNAKIALAMDSTNIRAIFMIANNDFYTPEKYGGGEIVESHLKKVIALPNQKIKNNLLPSWGKEEAYEMFIKWYMKKERWNDAKLCFQKAILKFPESYNLSQLATQLIGK